MARILASYVDENRKVKKYTMCGSVRTPERDAEGVYDYLDPDNVIL